MLGLILQPLPKWPGIPAYLQPPDMTGAQKPQRPKLQACYTCPITGGLFEEKRNLYGYFKIYVI
jgi:hypothetical protein